MAKSKSLYDLLGVAQTATLDEIKRAYRDKIRTYHPDKYAAERSKLERDGYVKALEALDRDIVRAKQMTQKFNEAYSVLSDETSRAAYDHELSAERYDALQREMQRKREQHPEYGRRTVKTRSHRRPHAEPTVVDQTVPWAILGVLVVVLLVVFGGLSDFLWQVDERINTYSPNAPTAEGAISAADLQSTVTAREATFVARTQVASLPTSTPRPLSEIIDLADLLLFEMEQYEYAAEQYTQALETDTDNAELLYKRGLAYAALYAEDDTEIYALSGIEDFGAALALEGTADAYRERGLLGYALWQQTGDETIAATALADLEQYISMSEDIDTDVEAALSDLAE